jgi:magnesium transporter
MAEFERHTEREARQQRELIEVDDELMQDIEELVRTRSNFLLLNILQDLYPADIAHILNRLDGDDVEFVFSLLSTETASDVLPELADESRELLVQRLAPSALAKMLDGMASDDAADIIGEMPAEAAEHILGTMDVRDSSHVEELLRYHESTAGGIMAKEVAVVNEKATVKNSIRVVRRLARDHKNIYNLYVVDEDGILLGTVALQELLLYAPNKRIKSIMTPDVLSVTTDVDQEEVARLFKKYDIVSLPVTDTAGKLLGRITVDDIVDVLEEEHEEDVARMVGSDAEELERRSPTQVAMLRLPWVLITLLLEMVAAIVVSRFDKTLSQVILLAAFMPIISALSGNTGLQSAAVVVRGLATGHVELNRWWRPVLRQLQITLIIGSVCGILLGVVGAVWQGNSVFGFVVGFSMLVSINISGFIGTTSPMLSKRLGFDPAITAGPFETALQDVVGITIFLSIATLLLRWL